MLLLAQDKADYEENANWKMYINWMILQCVTFFYPTTFLVMGYFYSETDEQKSFVSLFLTKRDACLGISILLSIQKSVDCVFTVVCCSVPLIRVHERSLPACVDPNLQHTRLH